jgi:hypothetical protein
MTDDDRRTLLEEAVSNRQRAKALEEQADQLYADGQHASRSAARAYARVEQLRALAREWREAAAFVEKALQ